MSLSAITALFAGLPAKAAAASLVAVAGAGGLVATDTMPEPAMDALEAAAEKVGFELPADDRAPVPDVEEEEQEPTALPDEAVDGQERAAQARDEAAAKKAAALQKAAEASVNADGANAEGLERAAAGRENSDGATTEPEGTAGEAENQRAPVPTPGETQARDEAGATEDEARDDAADEADDASAQGSSREAEARADAQEREDEARSDAGEDARP